MAKGFGSIVIYVYNCMNAACGYIEQKTIHDMPKCPKCGYPMRLLEKK